jgi:hypothetical protein
MIRAGVLVVAMVFTTAACGEETPQPPKGIEEAMKVLEKALSESTNEAEKEKLKEAIAALKRIANASKVQNDLVADFTDHPDKYKGRVLTFRAVYGANFPKGKTLGLAQQAGSTGVPFRVRDPKTSAQLDMEFDIPKDFKLPPVPAGVAVILTFKCKEGKTNEGNELIEITRP